jgi:hypothetical protein
MSLLNLPILRARQSSTRRRTRTSKPTFRPAPDGMTLESRTVLSTAAAPAAVAPVDVQTAATQALPITVTGVSLDRAHHANQLVANVAVGSHNVQVPVTMTSNPSDPSILSLHLAPIDLNLLGLEVKTSDICLNITATPGPGNLLGNLLSGIANLLNGGTPLGNILGSLSHSQLTTLTSGVTQLLDGALNDVLTQSTATPFPSSTASAASTASTAADPATSILHLSLGPVNLNLLGLNVTLDNCAGGPITVDVIAHSGPGLLLGNLLTDIANLLNPGGLGGLTSGQLNQITTDLETLITDLLNAGALA